MTTLTPESPAYDKCVECDDEGFFFRCYRCRQFVCQECWDTDNHDCSPDA